MGRNPPHVTMKKRNGQKDEMITAMLTSNAMECTGCLQSCGKK